MRCAFIYLCLFAFGSCSFASSSGSRQVPTASETYDQRLLEIVDRAASEATDPFPALVGANVHWSFRIDPAGRLSRVRVFGDRPSDHHAAELLAQAIRAAHFPPPPPQAMQEQGHRWYDIKEYVFLVGAD
jgi:hypothetical protein